MKKKHFLRHTMQAAAALFVAATVAAGFTACTDDDDVNTTPGGRMAGELVGTWLSSYGQKGTVAKTDGKTTHYIKAVQALQFNNDGTGTCWHFLCDIKGEPVSLFGGAGDASNGRFRYTVSEDSTITINRVGDGDGANPKTWTLRMGADGLSGSDGATEYLMNSADSGWQEYIAGLEEDFRTGANADKPDFLTNWQECKTVRIEGLNALQYLPWAGSADSDISDEIRFDVQKEAGWEMAFNALNDPRSKNTRFFGLYNRFTGTLRVFNYVLEPGSQGYGKEMGYMFHADGDKYMPRYPFYNSMEYSIPVCHDYADENTFDRNVTLTTNGTNYKPFETMISAYTRNTEAIGVSAGWHCTDFDFSGYQKEGISWTDHAAEEGTLLSIRPYSQGQSDVLLSGKIIGDIKGQFKDPTYETTTTGTTCSQINGVVGAFAGMYSGLFGQLNTTYACLNNAEKLREDADYVLPFNAISWLSIGGAALNIASCTMKIIDIFGGKSSKTEYKSPGTINMTLDAKIDLSGTIKTWNTVNDAGVRLTPELLKISNATKDTVWVGSGCFGLAEDPVVYISKEDLLSVSNSIAISKNADGESYTAPSFKKDSVRLVSFLDPRTVKLCLNTDLYHDIQDLNVIINYGVNVNRSVGNTDCFRKMMKLGDRPTFSILPVNPNDKKLTVTTTPRLHVMKKHNVIKNDFFVQNCLDSVKLENPKGSVLPLYGRFDDFCTKRLVMDPQVFVPFTPDSTIVYPAQAPDFIVSVIVSFKCKECPDGVVFSRAYIPKVQLIGHKDLKTFYTELKDYSDKCINKQPIGVLYNDNKVKVYSNCGDVMLAKTLDILNKCK